MRTSPLRSLLILVAAVAATAVFSPASFARRPHKGQGPSSGSTQIDETEESYEAGLADVCDQRDQERSKAAAAGKISFYSEECLPLSIENRRLKRRNEKKNFTVCEGARSDEQATAQRKGRVHLRADCFNLVPDAALEVALPEPVDPMYQNPPAGMWAQVKFLSCAKNGTCTPLARSSPAGKK